MRPVARIARRRAARALRALTSRRLDKVRGMKGQSPETVTSAAVSGMFCAAQSSPARMPASGPAIGDIVGHRDEAGGRLAASAWRHSTRARGIAAAGARRSAPGWFAAAMRDLRLVAAAHAPRAAAGEHQPEGRRRFAHGRACAATGPARAMKAHGGEAIEKRGGGRALISCGTHKDFASLPGRQIHQFRSISAISWKILSHRPPGLAKARSPRHEGVVRRDGRVVEGARLESVFTGNCNVGSNPTLSATAASGHRCFRPL